MKGFPSGDARATSAGISGGHISAQQRKEKREAYWRGQGIDPVLAEAIRRDGYQAGYAMGRKERLTRVRR